MKRLIRLLISIALCVTMLTGAARALSDFTFADPGNAEPVKPTRTAPPPEALELLPEGTMMLGGKGYGSVYYHDGVEIVWNGEAWVPAEQPGDEEIEAALAEADALPVEPDMNGSEMEEEIEP